MAITHLDREPTHEANRSSEEGASDRVGAVGRRTVRASLRDREPDSQPAFTSAQLAQFSVQRAALQAIDSDPCAGILPGPHIGMDGVLSAEAAARRPTPEDVARATSRSHHTTAAAGVAGPGEQLPHLATIQHAFGPHDVSSVRAHTGGAAATASRDLGAMAYATGNDVAFASSSPDLHTAAHEAAHVVQQRGGVQLKDGLGQTGDAYEQHADAVADAVVRGESAVSVLDAMAGSGGSSSGSSSIQRQNAVAAATRGPGVPGISLRPASRPLAEASGTLKMAAASSHEQLLKLRSGRVTAATAAAEMQIILAGCASAISTLATYHRKAQPDPTAAPAPGGATAAAKAPAEQDHIDQEFRQLAMSNLDALVGDALEIVRDLDDGAPERGRLSMALDGITHAARGLGWTRPASLGDARDRKFEWEACPAGENDESPRACVLADAERVEARGKIVRRLKEIAETFFEECSAIGNEFRKAIEADRRIDELIVTIAVDLLVMAATAGLGAPVAAAAGTGGAAAAGTAAATGTTAAATGAAAVADTAARSGAKAASSSASKFATDIGKSLTKTTFKLPNVTGSGSKGDARADTITALAALAAQFQLTIKASENSLQSLDDSQLIMLERTLAAYPTGDIKQHVRVFANNYLKQVAPIGKDHTYSDAMFTDGGWHRDDKQDVVRAVKIVMPNGKTKLALVDEITDQRPGLRKAARTLGVAADRVIGDKDDQLFTGGEYRQQQEDFINEPAVERHFIRWIDDPRMAAVADDDAATVPADKVEGIPPGMMIVDQWAATAGASPAP